MNTDFHIQLSFFTHPKRRKLEKRLGKGACFCLIELWSFTAFNKPDGILANMTTEDIEIAADWNGEDGVFVSTLIDVRFLDRDAGTYLIHDWRDHNPYATGALDRSRQSARASAIRDGKKAGLKDKKLDEFVSDRLSRFETKVSDRYLMDNHLDLIRSSPSPSPVPSPSPSPVPVHIPGKPGARVKVGPITEVLERDRAEYPEIYAFIQELFPDVWTDKPKELKSQADALRLIIHQDTNGPAETIFEILRWAQSDIIPGSSRSEWQGWGVQFKSFRGLRRKRDGVSKFDKIWAAYQASLKKPLSKRIDDDSKFTRSGPVDLGKYT